MKIQSAVTIIGLMVVIVGLKAQNVGIGTDDPVSRLHVVGDIRSDSIYVMKHLGIGTDSAVRPLTIRAANGYFIGLENAAGDEKWKWYLNVEDKLVLSPGSSTYASFVARPNGNIGMGTHNPGAKLHLAEYSTAPGANDFLKIQNYSSGGAGIKFMNTHSGEDYPWQCFLDSDDKFKFGRHEIGNYLTIVTGGNVGIGTTYPGVKLDVFNQAYNSVVARFVTEAGWGEIQSRTAARHLKWGADDVGGYIGTSTSDKLRFFVGGYPTMTFNATGQIGIGTESPFYRVDAHINGTNATVAQFRTLGGFADVLVQNGTEQLALGVDNGGGYVRMQSAHDLRLQTTNVTRMCIDYESGHIGIGTISPSYRLDTQHDGANATLAQFKTTGGYANILVGNSSQTAVVGADDLGGYVGTNSANDLRITTGGLTQMFVRYIDGNIGMGTDAPAYRLDALSNEMNTTIAQFKNTGGYANILVSNSSKVATIGIDDLGAYVGTHSQDNIRFTTAGTTHLTVQHGSGNIGIGAELPVSKLHVLKSGNNVGTNDILLIENTGTGGAGIRFKNQAVSSELWQCYIENDGKFKVGRDGLADYMTIDMDGNVQFSGTILSEAVVASALLNNWVNYDAGFETAGYYKDKEGVVHLHGLIKSGTAAHIMTLPDGYRPGATHLFTVITEGGFARIDVQTGGTVTLVGSYSNAYVSLSGISFRP